MLANLRALFGVIVDIVLLRRGPEHLPVSRGLLVSVVVLNIAGSVLMAAVMPMPVANALLQAIVGSALTLAWFHVALAIAGKRERFLQTMSAIFAANTLFVPVVVPLFNALMPYLEKADSDTPPPAPLFMIMFFVGVWSFAVLVRIVRLAFECPWFGAILLILGEVFAASLVSMMLFGSPPKGG